MGYSQAAVVTYYQKWSKEKQQWASKAHSCTNVLFTEKDGSRGLNQQTVAQIGDPLNAKGGPAQYWS